MSGMAGSSRLAVRLLSRPPTCVCPSTTPLRSIRAATYATTSTTTATTNQAEDEATPTAVPDAAVLKRAKSKHFKDIFRQPKSATAIKPARRKSASNSGKKVGKPDLTPDTTSAFAHLPNSSVWSDAFYVNSRWDLAHRQFVANEKTIDSIIKSMDLEGRSKAAGRKLTILECYPGPGTLTRRLLQDENVEKVIALEDHKGFNQWLNTLSTDATLGENASKLHVINGNSFNWDTYSEMIDQGALDHIPAVKDLKNARSTGPAQYGDDWKAASPIILLAQLPTTVQAEQLLAQFVAAINRRYWQFRYTRMPMFFICSEHTAWRCTAQPGHRLRSRMSVLAQSVSKSQILLDSDHFSPHGDHFWPYIHTAGPRLPRTTDALKGYRISGSLSEYGSCLLLIEPRAEVLLEGADMDAFEYIITNLFVRKIASITSGLAHLAPGAVNLLSVLKKGHPSLAQLGPIDIDPETSINQMTHIQLVALAKVFERWPFKPQNYFEGHTTTAEERTVLQNSFG